MSENHRGRVYVVFYTALAPATRAPRVTCPPPFTVCRGQSLISSQVFLSFSDDRGVSWSTPKAIAPAIPGTFKRIFPVVLTGEDGMVSVFYYQIRETTLATPCNVSIGGGPRRVGSASSLADAFVVVSRNGGGDLLCPGESEHCDDELVHNGQQHPAQFWRLPRQHEYRKPHLPRLG